MYFGYSHDKLSEFAEWLQRIVLEEKPAGRRVLIGGCVPIRVACREQAPTTYSVDHGELSGMEAKDVRPHVEGAIAVCERFASIIQHMV